MESWRCVCCGAVRWGRGGRRRRIKATCAARTAKSRRACVLRFFEKRKQSQAKTSDVQQSCVSLNPRGKEEDVPRGRRRESLGTRRSDAEKRKSPGTAAGGKKKEEAAAQCAGTGRQAHKPASRTHAASKGQGPRGGGGASRAPGHTATHPADTPLTHPQHTRHTPATHPARAADTPLTHPTRDTPATHPADTPATHPQHTRPPHPAAPGTHPPSRTPHTPRPAPVRDRAEGDLCGGTGLSEV